MRKRPVARGAGGGFDRWWRRTMLVGAVPDMVRYREDRHDVETAVRPLRPHAQRVPGLGRGRAPASTPSGWRPRAFVGELEAEVGEGQVASPLPLASARGRAVEVQQQPRRARNCAGKLERAQASPDRRPSAGGEALPGSAAAPRSTSRCTGSRVAWRWKRWCAPPDPDTLRSKARDHRHARLQSPRPRPASWIFKVKSPPCGSGQSWWRSGLEDDRDPVSRCAAGFAEGQSRNALPADGRAQRDEAGMTRDHAADAAAPLPSGCARSAWSTPRCWLRGTNAHQLCPRWRPGAGPGRGYFASPAHRIAEPGTALSSTSSPGARGPRGDLHQGAATPPRVGSRRHGCQGPAASAAATASCSGAVSALRSGRRTRGASRARRGWRRRDRPIGPETRMASPGWTCAEERSSPAGRGRCPRVLMKRSVAAPAADHLGVARATSTPARAAARRTDWITRSRSAIGKPPRG